MPRSILGNALHGILHPLQVFDELGPSLTKEAAVDKAIDNANKAMDNANSLLQNLSQGLGGQGLSQGLGGLGNQITQQSIIRYAHDPQRQYLTTSTDSDWILGNWGDTSSATTITSNISPDQLWAQWVQQSTGANTRFRDYEQELRTEFAAEQAARRTRDIEIRRERQRARERAEKLLVANLTPEQAAQFKSERCFVVHTANGQRRYRVEYGTQGNIKLLDSTGRAITKFCIHPEMDVPTEDVMLAQKFMIETDEATFLRTANQTRIGAWEAAA